MENRRLRAEDQEASKRVDLEAELEEARGDVAGLTERVTREQLAEANARVTRELEAGSDERAADGGER